MQILSDGAAMITPVDESLVNTGGGSVVTYGSRLGNTTYGQFYFAPVGDAIFYFVYVDNGDWIGGRGYTNGGFAYHVYGSGNYYARNTYSEGICTIVWHNAAVYTELISGIRVFNSVEEADEFLLSHKLNFMDIPVQWKYWNTLLEGSFRIHELEET